MAKTLTSGKLLKLSTSNRKLLPTVKKQLRDKVPKLDYTHVRRAKILFHEALLSELRESGHKNTFALLNELIEIDAKVDHVSLMKKRLIDDHELVEKIVDCLKNAEFSEKPVELNSFLNLAKYIENGDKSFIWIAKQLYVTLLHLASSYKSNGPYYETVAKYFYGKFLHDKELNFYDAVIYTEEAKNICRDDLTIENDKGEISKLQTLICKQLCRSLIKFSEGIRTSNPAEALLCSKKALRNAQSTGNVELEIDSEIEIANCYQIVNNQDDTIGHLKKALDLATAFKSYVKYCDVCVKLSSCFNNSQDYETCEDNLLKALEITNKIDLKELKGDILLKLGQNCIKLKNQNQAQIYFLEAVVIFSDLKLNLKLQVVRLWSASFAAQENYNNLVDTILRSDKGIPGRNQYLQRLINWYDRKIPIVSKYHDSYHVDPEDSNIDVFIKKYYDVDEITEQQFK
ncbi:unnamed protein product [Diamesa serratosioi]